MDTAMVEDLDTLWDILVSVVSDQELPNLICTLDGLDELDSGSQRDLLERLNKLYSQKDLQAQPFVKFLGLSKPENLIKTCFNRNTATVRLKGEDKAYAISKDVELVVQNHMDEIKTQGVPHNVLVELQQALVHRADRTFLWTSLIINLLKDAAMDGASGKELKELVVSNRGIGNVYAVLLSRSTNNDGLNKLLQIILAARRPLTLQELNVALVISPQQTTFQELESELKSPMENYIKATSGHFIRIVHNQVYLVHQTARDFLLQREEDSKVSHLGPWYRSLNEAECDNVLLRSCIWYICLQNVTEYGEFVEASYKDHLRFNYYRNWARHCLKNHLNTIEEILHVALHIHGPWPENRDQFSFAHNLVLRWDNLKFALLAEDILDVLGTQVGSIQLTLDFITETFLSDSRVALEACDPKGRTLLHHAAAKGSVELVKKFVAERSKYICKRSLLQISSSLRYN